MNCEVNKINTGISIKSNLLSFLKSKISLFANKLSLFGNKLSSLGNKLSRWGHRFSFSNNKTMPVNRDMAISIFETTQESRSSEFDMFLAFMNDIFSRVYSNVNSNINLHTADEVIDYIDNSNNSNDYTDYAGIKLHTPNEVIDYIDNSPFCRISILENTGIAKHILLDREELQILRFAVLYNRGIINLCSRTNSIVSLMNKGLIQVSTDNDYLVVNRIVSLMFKRNRKKEIDGNILKAKNDNNREIVNNNNSNSGMLYISDDLREEISEDENSRNGNRDIIGLYWSMPDICNNNY